MLLRSCVMAIATLAAAGCASTGYYGGGYDTYPGETYYDSGPADYGSYGYGAYGYSRPYAYGYPAYNPYFYDHRDRRDRDRHDDNDDDRDHNHKRKHYDGDSLYYPGACDRDPDHCGNKHGVSNRWTNRNVDDRPSRQRKIEQRQRLADDANRDGRRPSAEQRDNGGAQGVVQRQRLKRMNAGNACPPKGCLDN
jgi:hypothetical protein